MCIRDSRIIIPVQAEYLPAKGLEQLLSTVSKVKRQINPKLQIDGILLTMVDNRTNFAKEIAALLLSLIHISSDRRLKREAAGGKESRYPYGSRSGEK